MRLTVQASAVARELAGRTSARLLLALGIYAPRHTMLRVLLKVPPPTLAVPRVRVTHPRLSAASLLPSHRLLNAARRPLPSAA
jgi:hypothetical protein